ncbi:hypothetical protein [Phenylobacterium sp.]|uniref:hypothetical protein n=1 Tax=Phenylobacterium sp. TaxID=1871053 RepID=UPI00394D8F53
MKKLIACALALGLSACASRPLDFERTDTALNYTVERYCSLHPLARAALRAQLTDGVPVIVCPSDIPATTTAPQR